MLLLTYDGERLLELAELCVWPWVTDSNKNKLAYDDNMHRRKEHVKMWCVTGWPHIESRESDGIQISKFYATKKEAVEAFQRYVKSLQVNFFYLEYLEICMYKADKLLNQIEIKEKIEVKEITDVKDAKVVLG